MTFVPSSLPLYPFVFVSLLIYATVTTASLPGDGPCVWDAHIHKWDCTVTPSSVRDNNSPFMLSSSRVPLLLSSMLVSSSSSSSSSTGTTTTPSTTLPTINKETNHEEEYSVLQSPVCLYDHHIYIVADSIGRYMFFDFILLMAECTKFDGSGPIPSVSSTHPYAELCSYASYARKHRGNYDVTIPFHWLLMDGTGNNNDGGSLPLQDDDDYIVNNNNHDERSKDMITISFRSVTTVRNISSLPWFTEVFYDTLSSSVSSPAKNRKKQPSVILFNVGLWNLKYDNYSLPLATVRHNNPFVDQAMDLSLRSSYATYLTELQEFIQTQLLLSSSSPVPPIFWRTINPLEYNQSFPNDYNNELIRAVNNEANQLWTNYYRTWNTKTTSGSSSLLRPDANIIHTDQFGYTVHRKKEENILTIDGTHYKPWLNTIMMQYTFNRMCASTLPPMSTSRLTNKQLSDAQNEKKIELPTVTPAPINNNSSTVVFATGSTYPFYLLLSSIIIGILSYQLRLQHKRLRSLLRTRNGVIGIFIFIWLATFFADFIGVLPRVTKERKVGADMLFGICGIVLGLSFLTIQETPTHQASTHSSSVSVTPPVTSSSSSLPTAHSSTDSSVVANTTVAKTDDIAISVASSTSSSSQESLNSNVSLNNDDTSIAKQEKEAFISSTPSSVSIGGGDNSVPHTSSSSSNNSNHETVSSSSSAFPMIPFPLPAFLNSYLTESTVSMTSLQNTIPFMTLDVTNELKGSAMVFFLLYHYWDVKLVYNPVRVLVAAFLFLTGYGNFISLSGKAPTLNKFCLSFIRINLLAAILMTAVRQPWMLYYICPLHTFWTVMVYAFFAIGSKYNHSKRNLFIKLVITTILHLVLFEITLIRDNVFMLLYPLLTFRSSLYEWLFRVTLDAYAPLFGMWMAFWKPDICIFIARINGIIIPSSSSSSETTDNSSSTVSDHGSLLTNMVMYVKKHKKVLTVGFILVSLLLLHGFTIYPLSKATYNSTHRFTAPIPIGLYILIRNITPSIARHYVSLIASFGSCSLDMYLLQFHLWLANNAKDIVVLFPESRWVSFLLHSLAFVTLAWCASIGENVILTALNKDHKLTYYTTGIILIILVTISVIFTGEPRVANI